VIEITITKIGITKIEIIIEEEIEIIIAGIEGDRSRIISNNHTTKKRHTQTCLFFLHPTSHSPNTTQKP